MNKQTSTNPFSKKKTVKKENFALYTFMIYMVYMLEKYAKEKKTYISI